MSSNGRQLVWRVPQDIRDAWRILDSTGRVRLAICVALWAFGWVLIWLGVFGVTGVWGLVSGYLVFSVATVLTCMIVMRVLR